MPYDLFISYSRRDNQTGRVTELMAQINADYRTHTGEELRPFFDLAEINAMDDWRNRILGGLRESNLLLLILSPAYLESEYCEWEIVEFLKYENSRAVQGQGVAQVYFVEIPGLDTKDFEQQAAAWVAKVRQRNHVDLRPWFDEGADTLKRADIRTRLEDLERSIFDRLSRLRRIADAPGNLPAHNPRFVGREVEMERLHKAAGLGQYGLLTAVQGLGGMGKTALAIQYAYAYADFYPGGRWLIGCAGQTSLAAAIRSLDSDLGIQFTDEEKRDAIRAAKRVLSVLDERAKSGAAAHAGEKNPPEPRALLLFDNVDAPALLQPPHTDLLSGRKWLHIIATTRLAPYEFGIDEERLCHLAVDELPEEDAVRLIENYQPQGRFPDETERAAAHEIVRLLCGFPLAVEVVAVHLAERKNRVSCAAILQRLRNEGVDDIARQTKGALPHAERLVSATLLPTLEALEAEENKVLIFAALLPPDSVALPWLRALVAKEHPELRVDAEAGYDDPWLCIVNHLVGLRLLQVIEWNDDGLTPRLCRMHRLIQTVVKQRVGGDLSALDNDVMEMVKGRAEFLEEGWLDWNNRWEIHPLSAYAWQAIEAGAVEAPYLVSIAARCLQELVDYARAEPLFRSALEISIQSFGGDHTYTSAALGNLALLLKVTNKMREAEPLFRRALAISEESYGPNHPEVATTLINLALLLKDTNRLVEAEHLFRRALAILEENYEPNHPNVAITLNGLALLLNDTNRLVEAEPLFRHALAIDEENYGSNHPEVAAVLNNLALLLQNTNRLMEAEPLFRRALDIWEEYYGEVHPHVASALGNLGTLLARTNRMEEAEQLERRALGINEKIFGSNHLAVALNLNSLAILLQDTNRLVEAEPLLLRALEINEESYGSNHPIVATFLNNLANLLHRTNRLAEAEPLMRRALAISEESYGSNHPDVANTLNSLACLLKASNRLGDAEPLMRRALSIGLDFSRHTGHPHQHLKLFTDNYTILLTRMGLSHEQASNKINELRREHGESDSVRDNR